MESTGKQKNSKDGRGDTGKEMEKERWKSRKQFGIGREKGYDRK